MLIFLGLLFGVIGIVSSIIGLGGGTFYLIFMGMFKIPYTVIPIISLMSNIVVSGMGASVRLIKKERCSLILLVFILIPSIICSFIGASIQIEAEVFRLVLNFSLLIIILLRIVLQRQAEKKQIQITTRFEENFSHQRTRILITCACISGMVGFVSGIIGIGGGIILGPILYIYGFSYRTIPLVTAIYICINSIVGITVHFQKLHSFEDISPYLFLPLISIIISMVSIYAITFRLNSKTVRNIALTTIIIITIYNIITQVM